MAQSKFPSILSLLSYDVFHRIADRLEADDILNLAHSHAMFKYMVTDSYISKNVLKLTGPYTREYKLAQESFGRNPSNDIYYKALKHCLERRSAFANGSPRIAIDFGLAQGFSLNHGILAIVGHDHVRLVDTFRNQEQKMDFQNIFGSGHQKLFERLTYSYYSSGYLSLVFTPDDRETSHKLYIIKAAIGMDTWNTDRIIDLGDRDEYQFFVRNTDSYMFYGIYTCSTAEIIGDGWRIHHVVLKGANDPAITQLKSSALMHGKVGFRADFVIHSGHFWAASVENAHYFLVRCKINQFNSPQNEEIHQVDRKMGSGTQDIDDEMAHFTLQISEQNNQVMIVENYLMTPMNRDHASGSVMRSFLVGEFASQFEGRKTVDRLIHRASGWGSILVKRVIDYFFKSTHVHRDLDNQQQQSINNALSKKSKLSYYNLTSRAFIDIIHSPFCNLKGSGDCCIQLQSGSTKANLDDLIHGFSKQDLEMVETIQKDTRIKSKFAPVQLWPPTDSSSTNMDDQTLHKAHQIMGINRKELEAVGLDATKHNDVDVQIAADERNLVYLIQDHQAYYKPARLPSHRFGKLVFLSFDAESGLKARNQLPVLPSGGELLADQPVAEESDAGENRSKRRRIGS